MNHHNSNIDLFGETRLDGMPRHFFIGVRRMKYTTARRADISKQNYTVCPRHWYIDAVFVCRDCGDEFVFTADEQCFWYEDRQFYVDSLPKSCVKCRKAQRANLELRKRYDALISEALGRCSEDTKKEVVGIINELEVAEEVIPEKMRENLLTLYAQIAKSHGARNC